MKGEAVSCRNMEERINMFKKNITVVIKRIIQVAPLVMVGICALLYLKFFRGVTIQHILDFTPENLWLAALVMVGLFALKSMSLFFPMLILIAASGSIFPTFLSAFIVNCIGVAVMILIPYAVGRFAEREFVEGLINKHKNAAKLHELKSDNELFIAYFLRVINILPCDLVSMFLGSAGFGLWKYMLGSFLGILPGIVTTTLMGANADHPTSPKFWLSVVVEFVFAGASSVWYYFYKKKKKSKKIPKQNKYRMLCNNCCSKRNRKTPLLIYGRGIFSYRIFSHILLGKVEIFFIAALVLSLYIFVTVKHGFIFLRSDNVHRYV